MSALQLLILALTCLALSNRHDRNACLHTAQPNVLVVVWLQLLLQLLLFLPFLLLLLVVAAVVVAAATAAAAHFHACS